MSPEYWIYFFDWVCRGWVAHGERFVEVRSWKWVFSIALHLCVKAESLTEASWPWDPLYSHVLRFQESVSPTQHFFVDPGNSNTGPQPCTQAFFHGVVLQPLFLIDEKLVWTPGKEATLQAPVVKPFSPWPCWRSTFYSSEGTSEGRVWCDREMPYPFPGHLWFQVRLKCVPWVIRETHRRIISYRKSGNTRKLLLGWRDTLVRSTGCSSRAPALGSRHLHLVTHKCLF